jgi:hypothetical protein
MLVGSTQLQLSTYVDVETGMLFIYIHDKTD